MQLIAIVLRCLAATAGLLLCYGALFLYEDEQRVLQSTLETLWIEIDDLRRNAVRKHVALLRVAATASLEFLDRLFGRSLLSTRAIGVAICISLASLLLVSDASWAIFGYFMEARGFKPIPPSTSLASIVQLALLGGELFLGSALEPFRVASYGFAAAALLALVAQFTSARTIEAPFIVAFAFLVLVAVNARHSHNEANIPIIATVALIIGVLCDLSAVAVLRRLLRRQMRAAQPHEIVGPTCAELLVAVLLILTPLAIAKGILFVTVRAQTEGLVSLGVALWFGALVAMNSNFGSAAVALLFVASIIVLALHRAIWPVISRPLYQLAQLRLFASWRTRSALFALGVALLMTSVDEISPVFKAVWSIFSAA